MLSNMNNKNNELYPRKLGLIKPKGVAQKLELKYYYFTK